MKPPERFPPDDPREWLNRARSNLAQAGNRLPETYIEDHCFNAQQATEKAIKAIFLLRGIDYPHIHDLARLMSLLEEAGEELPETVRRGATLTRYAVQTRYPSLVEPVSEKEYDEALSIAQAVVYWAEGKL